MEKKYVKEANYFYFFIYLESMPDVCANKPARRTTAAEDDPSFPLNSVLQECTTAKENAEAGDVDQK